MIEFYEDREDKSIAFSNLIYWKEQGHNTTLYINSATALNLEELISVCERCNEIGATLEISNREFDKIFFSNEKVEMFFNNLNLAQKVLNYEINFSSGFNREDVIFANKTLNNWVNQITSMTCNGEYLSPLEKFVACYEIATNYVYKLERADEEVSLSRSLPHVLNPNNDKICCAGFANILWALLNRCGVACEYESIGYVGDEDTHAVNAVKLIDEKYGINTIFRADPTFGGIDKFGRTLAGICRSYETINNYHIFEKFLGEKNLGFVLPKSIENLMPIKVQDLDILPNQDLYGNEAKKDPNFAKKNYFARVELFIKPIIDKIFKTIRPEKRNIGLLEINEKISEFKNNRLPYMFIQRGSLLSEVLNNKDLSQKDASEQFENYITKFNDALYEFLEPICRDLLSVFPIDYNNAKNYLIKCLIPENLSEKKLEDMQFSDLTQDLFFQEQTLSQEYLLLKEAQKMSKNLSPLNLALAVRNVAIARGLDVVEACAYSADILTRSVKREYMDLKSKNMLNSDEVFSILLQEPFVSKQDFEKLKLEKQENAKITKLKLEDLNTDGLVEDHSAQLGIDNKIYQNINYMLLAESVNEAIVNPKLKQNYKRLFEDYPTLINSKEPVSSEYLIALDSGELYVNNSEKEI